MIDERIMYEMGRLTTKMAKSIRPMLIDRLIVLNFLRLSYSKLAVEKVFMRATSSRALADCDAPIIWMPHSAMNKVANSTEMPIELGFLITAKAIMSATRVMDAAK